MRKISNVLALIRTTNFLFILLFVHINLSSSQQIDKQSFQAQLSNAINENFLKSVVIASNQSSSSISPSEFAQNLASFQTDLVRKRNAECLFEKHQRFEWSAVAFEKLNRSLLDSRPPSMDAKSFSQVIIDELNKKCIDASSLVELFVNNQTTSYQDYDTVLKIVLSQLKNEGCDMCHQLETLPTISRKETWIYGILFVTLINLSSLCGVFIIPLSNRKFYKKTLMFLIAIAVGSLAGSGFLHLIPQAFSITEDTKYSMNHAYVWKAVVMMGGVYLFYVVEKIMKIIIQRKKILRKKSIDEDLTVPYYNSQILESIGYLKTHEPNLEPNLEMRIKHLLNMQKELAPRKSQHGHSHGAESFYSVAPVAWMIIFGDGLHNFIDGLSIGAAFSESALKGISICLAVICEEFPHELGDFAILINAGMSYPVALFFNFLSACCCYAGLAVGITLGENFGANEWIYAIAGGMFLYISLCDMIPELNEMGEEIERDHLYELNAAKSAGTSSNRGGENQNQNRNDEEDESRKALRSDVENVASGSVPATSDPISRAVNFSGSDGGQTIPSIWFKIKILVIQNIGIVSGFMCMLLMAIHSESITLSD